MVNRIVAFDIDGTLTNEEVRKVFNKLQAEGGTTVGIVTSNPPLLAHSFISKHNLEPDFQQSAFIKARALFALDSMYRPEEKAYIGNSVTDELYSDFTRWNFIHASDTESLSELAGAEL